MKLELTVEQQKWQEEFQRFVDMEVLPYAEINDKEERIHPNALSSLKEKGYLGSMLPKHYGGMGLDNITIGLLNEEIGRACSSVRSLLTVQGMIALAILRWGTDAQRAEWLSKFASGEAIGAVGLTEPNAGSDAKSIETTAIRDGDDYVINGHKRWITMGQIADVFLIFAKCEGKPTAFIVERFREGFNTKPMSGLLGARASMIAELSFENCRIPSQNLLGQIGTGLSHVALSSLDYGRYTIAWGCVGLAQACLEASIDYASKRVQFGRPIRENQLIQKMITEIAVQLKASRLLCFKAGYLKDTGDPDSIMETWSAKYYASTMVTMAADYAVQIHGGNGCHEGYPVERYFRDAKINEIIEGTTQMHELLIATQEIVNVRRLLRRKSREGA